MLHKAAVPVPAPDRAEALRRRLDRALATSRARLARDQASFLAGIGQRITDLETLVVVPCHLDFTPRNWLVDKAGTVRVIDFAGSTRELVARDLARLAFAQWLERPQLRDAFLTGYGRDLDPDENRQLALCAAPQAVAFHALALTTGDHRLRRRAERSLDLLRRAGVPGG